MSVSFYIIMITITRFISIFASTYAYAGAIIPYNTWWGIVLWVLFFVFVVISTVVVYKNGEKLPSVREAAGELGVNPNTIARAYTLLEEEGYVCSLPKKGAFVIFGEPQEREEPDKKAVIYALRDMGISKKTLLEWIEEVYKND